jgi:molecular chaperone DnaK (HSP70)
MHTSSLPQDVSAEIPDPDSDMSVYRASRQRASKWATQQLEAAAKIAKKGRMQPGFAARLLDALEREREKVDLFERVWKAKWEVDEFVRQLETAGADDDEHQSKTLKESLDELEKSLRTCEPWMKRFFKKETEVLESDVSKLSPQITKRS